MSSQTGGSPTGDALSQVLELPEAERESLIKSACGEHSPLSAVLIDCLRRRAAGEAIDDRAIIAAHPELMPELGEELRKLRIIAAARERAKVAKVSDVALASGDGDNFDTATFARDDSIRERARLEVRCPSCHAPVELAFDTALTDVTCSSCGSQFSLVNQNDASQLAPPLAMLGRFELISRLGMGAFGSVWKARDKELDRSVAIKIPRAGGMTPEEQEKFFREARAAAQLRHPNIVSVHEVGRDGDSVYIVSDYVRGVTLADWLSGQQPTSREAAELCAKIADALHHAHEKGVVHRDLKPANIMIDGDGQPHLMDFGLAHREVGEVTVTLDGHVLGTPAYMSPEQAAGESHKADRRSDVYSLGVILFQLLTGELPFRGNLRMLIHQVINDEPPNPRKLNGNIPKDLETITLKCLSKEPARRYQTTSDFAEELRRYGRGEPIHARPVSRPERAVRWVRRNRTVSAISAVAILALVSGSVVSTLFAIDARRQAAAAEARKAEAESERNNAQAVVDFLTEDVLAKASPEETTDKAIRDIIVKNLIEPAAATVGTRFENQPLVEAVVRDTLAVTLDSLGRADLALQHAEKALKDIRRICGENHSDTITSLTNYATVLVSLGRLQEAEPLLKQVLHQSRTSLGDDHLDTITALNDYAHVLDLLGRSPEAEPLYKQALERSRKVLGEDNRHTLTILNGYALMLLSLGRLQDAEPLLSQSLEQHRALLGEDNPRTIAALNNYAHVLTSQWRLQEAEPLCDQALELSRKVLGPDHPEVVKPLANYASLLLYLGRPREAESHSKLALDLYRTNRGAECLYLASSSSARLAVELDRNVLGLGTPADSIFGPVAAVLRYARS